MWRLIRADRKSLDAVKLLFNWSLDGGENSREILFSNDQSLFIIQSSVPLGSRGTYSNFIHILYVIRSCILMPLLLWERLNYGIVIKRTYLWALAPSTLFSLILVCPLVVRLTDAALLPSFSHTHTEYLRQCNWRIDYLYTVEMKLKNSSINFLTLARINVVLKSELLRVLSVSTARIDR